MPELRGELSPVTMTDLLVAPCDHKAAKYAVEHWHYSRALPMPPIVKFGAWEDQRFIGAVCLSRGATPNLCRPYGLQLLEVCELTRIALGVHEAHVTQIVARAMAVVKRQNPLLRLVVSFADPGQGHHGGIYQAGNWTYAGQAGTEQFWSDRAGKLWHPRSLVGKYGTRAGDTMRSLGYVAVPVEGKHRYLYPLDKAMRRQIQKLAQPYPCRQSVESDTSRIQREEVGAAPTDGSNSNQPRRRL